MPALNISSLSDALPAKISEKSRFATFLTRCVFVTVVIALFGQPNALFVYFPEYPVIASLVMLLFFCLVLYAKLRVQPIMLTKSNLALPALVFFAYSLFSLSYAPNVAYGARILFSALFKYLLFLAIITVCVSKEDMRKMLAVITALGGLFSFQGLAYIVGFIFFNLQPGSYIGTISGYGEHGTDFGLVSLGILGFAKSINQIGGLRLPRCQAMFLEPSSLAEFLELSLFATLAWSALTNFRHKKRVYWLLGMQFGALLFTFSSAGWFAIGVGMAVYIGLRLFLRPGVISRRRLSSLARAAAATLGVAALLSLFSPGLALDVYKSVYIAKFVSDASEQTSSSDRLSKASDSAHLIQERPLFGWGTNQTSMVSANHASVGNAFLTVLTELGIVGLAVYLTMLGAIFWTVFDNMRLAYRTGSDTLIQCTAAWAGCIAASFIHSMFVDNELVFSYWISLSLVYVNRMLLLQPLSPLNGGISPQDAP